MEKKSETGLREDGVCGSRKNVISRDVSGWGCEAIRHQELLNGEVGKLHHPALGRPVSGRTVHDGDQT